MSNTTNNITPEQGEDLETKEACYERIDEKLPTNSSFLITAKMIRKVLKDMVETLWPKESHVEPKYASIDVILVSILKNENNYQLFVYQTCNDESCRYPDEYFIGKQIIFNGNTNDDVYENNKKNSIKTCQYVSLSGYLATYNITFEKEIEKDIFKSGTNPKFVIIVNNTNKASFNNNTISINDDNVKVVLFNTKNSDFSGPEYGGGPFYFIQYLNVSNNYKNGDEIKIIFNSGKAFCVGRSDGKNSIHGAYHIYSKKSGPVSGDNDSFYVNLLYWNEQWYCDGLQ